MSGVAADSNLVSAPDYLVPGGGAGTVFAPQSGTGSPRPARTAPPHIPALDGLRGVAVLVVMAYHFSLGHLGTVGPLFGSGWIGVDLFFVLSGFLITGILLAAKGSPHFFRNFYGRRTLRIFPLYFGVLAIVFLVLPRFVPLKSLDLTSPGGTLPFWLYYSNIAVWLYGWPAPAMGHFWSLAIEEQFYLFWPLIVASLGIRRLIVFCSAAITAVIVLRAAATLAHVSWLATTYLTPFRADPLLIGALAAVLIRCYPGDLLRILRWVLICAGMTLLLLLIARGGLSLSDPVMRCAGYPVADIFFASSVVAAASGVGPFTNFLSARVLVTAGKYSYGMYVFHQLLKDVWDRYLPVAKFGLIGHAVLATLATFAISYLSWQFYEVRFIRLKRFF
jgi:peptidoglycan/LPS O-acetylase OafA/YrhL